MHSKGTGQGTGKAHSMQQVKPKDNKRTKAEVSSTPKTKTA